MFYALLVLHLLICLGLIGVVLVQSGKGGGLAGGAFGGTAQTVFGGRGATDFMTRATMVLGVAFFVTSIVLALVKTNEGRTSRSVIRQMQQRASQQAPVTPSAPSSGTPSAPAPAGGTPAPAPAPAGR
jgi:preprotein translocase subunit SecG